MSVTYSTFCEKCEQEAPGVGDGGYIGAPSGAVGKAGERLTFGAIFEALHGVGAIHSEMEGLRAFFVRHSNHPISLSADTGRETRRKALAKLPGPKRPRPTPLGTWVASCECGEGFRSPVEGFVAAPSRVVDSRALARLADVGGRIEESVARVWTFPLADPEFFRFFADHSTHTITAGVEPAEAPSALPPTATLPTWRSEDHEAHLGVIPEALLPAAARLHHRLPAKRIESCEEIGASRNGALLGYLLPLLDAIEPEVRTAATRAIGKLNDPRIARPLGRGLLDEARSVGRAAQEALKSIGVSEEAARRQATTLRGPYLSIGSGQENVTGAEEIRREYFGRQEKVVNVPKGAVRMLSTAEQRSLLGHPQAFQRAEAYPLLRATDSFAADVLRSGVCDRFTFVHRPALEAALKLGIEIDQQRLLEVIEADHHDGTPAACSHLARRADSIPLERVIAACRKTNRAELLFLVGKTRKPAAYTYLAGLFKESVYQQSNQRPDMTAVAKAIHFYGGAPAVVKTIREVAHWDPEPLLDQLSSKSDAELLQRTLIWLLGSKYSGRRLAARYVDHHRIAACYPALVAAARKRNPEVVKHAWRSLIRLGDPATESTIASALDLSFPDEAFLGYWLSGNPKLAAAAKARKVSLAWTPKNVKPLAVWGEMR